jgi:hypothetical protein
MPSQIKVTKDGLTLQLDALTARDGDYFVAYLPQLNLCSHSLDSAEKAIRGLDDAVFLFFTRFSSAKKLQEKLKRLGWMTEGQFPMDNQSSRLVPSEYTSIPFHLLNSNPVKSKYPVNVPHFAEC